LEAPGIPARSLNVFIAGKMRVVFQVSVHDVSIVFLALPAQSPSVGIVVTKFNLKKIRQAIGIPVCNMYNSVIETF